MDVTEQAGRLGERIRSDEHADERICGHQPERLIESSRGQAQRRPRTLGPEMIHPTLKGCVSRRGSGLSLPWKKR
jgi:hypothetical protein